MCAGVLLFDMRLSFFDDFAFLPLRSPPPPCNSVVVCVSPKQFRHALLARCLLFLFTGLRRLFFMRKYFRFLVGASAVDRVAKVQVCSLCLKARRRQRILTVAMFVRQALKDKTNIV